MNSTDELFMLTADKDLKAREILIESNYGLVKNIARRYSDRGVADEDLFQIGVIGLIKAIDRFDRSYGVKFSTYAVPVISGEIKKFFREDGLIKVSRKIKEDGIKIRRFIKDYENRYGKTPTLTEVKEMTDLKEDEILLAFEAGEDMACIHDENYEWICACEDAHEQVLDRMVLGQLMQMLSDMERKLIIMRYFEELTQIETASRLSMSQVQVCRMEKRILKRWRECVL